MHMVQIVHTSAKPSHYNKEAEHYDAFNATNAVIINTTIEHILKRYDVKRVLDLTCGTGLQVFWLLAKGFDVVGYDINKKMLNIAKNKAIANKVSAQFLLGDMRTTRAGVFDAVITMFNAIGHLTKLDFEQVLINVHANLSEGGIYVFDIFNLDYLLDADNITKLTIDWLKRYDDRCVREIQYSTINSEGVLASYDIYHEQTLNGKVRVKKAFQTLQVYRSIELQALLKKCGFRVLSQTDIDGKSFHTTRTERILTVAQKI